jgi:hypothetical protein
MWYHASKRQIAAIYIQCEGTMLKRLIPILLVVASPAFAESAAYVGVWAQKSEDCKEEVGNGSASPIKITPKKIYGWEYECDIKRVSTSRSGWTLRLSCASEGTESPETVRFKISPGGLHGIWSWGTRDYVRCPR